jgi:hypothetical protein
MSRSLGHGLCHVTAAGVTVAGVTVDIRRLRFVMELGFIFNIVAFVKDSLRINTDPGYIGGHIY